MFFSHLCVWNYPLKLPWAKDSAISTNMDRRTGPIHLQALLSSHHHVLIYLYEPNATVCIINLWVQMMPHHLDYIKSKTIMLIRMAKIMMIHNHMRHLGKLFDVLPLLVIQSSPQPYHNRSHWLHMENNICVYKFNGKGPMQHYVLNQEHWSKFWK